MSRIGTNSKVYQSDGFSASIKETVEPSLAIKEIEQLSGL